MAYMSMADADIGGARVLRGFMRGGDYLRAGDILSRDDVLAIPIANRRALIDSSYIQLWPQAPSSQPAPDGQCFVIHRGGGQFDVLFGHKLNDHPLTKDEAEQLAASK